CPDQSTAHGARGTPLQKRALHATGPGERCLIRHRSLGTSDAVWNVVHTVGVRTGGHDPSAGATSPVVPGGDLPTGQRRPKTGIPAGLIGRNRAEPGFSRSRAVPSAEALAPRSGRGRSRERERMPPSPDPKAIESVLLGGRTRSPSGLD